MTSQRLSVNQQKWRRVIPPTGKWCNPETRRCAASEVQEIRKGLGAWLTNARQQAGLTRRQVVERMGSVSLPRGLSKLARLERGEEGVWGDRIPLLAGALSADEEKLGSFGLREIQALKAARERVTRLREANGQAQDAEMALLGRHVEALLKRFTGEGELDEARFARGPLCGSP